MERGNNSYRQETTMQDEWVKIGVLGCNSVRPRNVEEPPTGDGTAVGNAASAAAADSLAVGDGAEGSGAGSVALGSAAASRHNSSVALGSRSTTQKDNEVSLGAPATESAAESTREVTHVSEPTADSSAATKAYVDRINNIAPLNVGTAPSTPNDKSVAIGYAASCPGTDSAKVAIGAKADASGMNSCSIGAFTSAGGKTAIAEGMYANAIGDYGIAIGVNTLAKGSRATAISSYSQAFDTGTIAINNAYALGNTSIAFGYLSSTYAGQSLAIGSGSTVAANAPDANTEAYKADSINSVALGAFSYADEPNVVSVGNDGDSFDRWSRVTTNTDNSPATPSTTAPFWEKKTSNYPSRAKHLKRRIIHVADPIDGHNAATKNYVDANTSNMLIGKAGGNTAHVEDAWPSKPLELAIGGAYKQGDATKPPIEEGDDPSPEDQVLMVTGADTSDTGTSEQSGTPTPSNPVPIEVLENPVLRVTGADTSAAGVSLPIALPAEHPYLAALPDGTCDVLEIDASGNATLVAKVGRDTDVREVEDVVVGQYFSLKTTLPSFASADALTSSSALCSALPYLVDSFGIYRTWNGVCVKSSLQQSKDEVQAIIDTAAPMTVYAPIPGTRYPLGKLDIPSLPEAVSNVWVESNLAANVGVMYKRNINTLPTRSSSSITVANGTAKVNPAIFGSGLLATDDNVRVDSNFINARFNEFVKRLDYSFFGPFTVEFTGAFTGTKNEFGEIQHSYAGNIEHYEIYKANFRYTLTRAYGAGSKIEFNVQFKYSGNYATVTKNIIAKVVNLDTGLTVTHITPTYTTGYQPKYIFSVPVSTDIPLGTKLAFFMELA